MKRIELLAPAQNYECAVSAINCGADAIYIGANAFGARQNAKNNHHPCFSPLHPVCGGRATEAELQRQLATAGAPLTAA